MKKLPANKTAEFIADHVKELSTMANEAGLKKLAELLNEASKTAEKSMKKVA